MRAFCFGILQSDGGRTSTPQLPTPPERRRERAAFRASIAHVIGRHARTCRLAARIVTAACGPQRDKVRAPNDLRLHRDHTAHSIFAGDKPMTAYRISLALIGLVVVAVSEELS